MKFVQKPRLAAFAPLLALVVFAFVFACDDSEPETPTQAPIPTQEPIPTQAAMPTPTQVAETNVQPSPTAQISIEPLSIVTTSNIIGDWVKIVGGERVEVKSLVPRQGDPHVYQPGARDIADVADADAIFTVGLQLEGSWLTDLLENAAADEHHTFALGEDVDPLPFIEIHMEHGDDHEGHDHEDEEAHGDEDHEGHDHEDEEAHGDDDHEDEEAHGDDDHEGHDHEDEDAHEDEDHEGHDHEDEEAHGDDDHEDEEAHGDDDHEGHDHHDHGEFDPHFWFDPTRVQMAIHEIAHELEHLQPESGEYFEANADTYIRELEELDSWIKEHVSQIPEDKRILLTSHDAFGYFASRYGFKVVGVIIPGGGTEIEPSPSELAELAEVARDFNVKVIFSEAQLNDRLARTLADEVGIEVEDRIHTGSLAIEGDPADTYIGMMRHNVQTFVAALK